MDAALNLASMQIAILVDLFRSLGIKYDSFIGRR